MVKQKFEIIHSVLPPRELNNLFAQKNVDPEVLQEAQKTQARLGALRNGDLRSVCIILSFVVQCKTPNGWRVYPVYGAVTTSIQQLLQPRHRKPAHLKMQSTEARNGELEPVALLHGEHVYYPQERNKYNGYKHSVIQGAVTTGELGGSKYIRWGRLLISHQCGHECRKTETHESGLKGLPCQGATSQP
jgi:hypothetical protein